MKESSQLDRLNGRILRALSLHQHLSTLQVWYELTGNENGKKWVTKEEVLRRLEALANQGFVEPLSQEEKAVRWTLKKGKMFDVTFLFG
jgi:hypothetical protein